MMSKNIEIFNSLIINSNIPDNDKNILLKYIEELEERDKILTALEAGGVNNREWYSESLEDYFKDEDDEEEEE